MTNSHLLKVGDLVFSDGSDSRPGLEGSRWWLEVEGESLDTGAAEPIERTIRSLLQDGAVVISEGLDNRTASFRVSVCGNDSGDLADGEAALWSLVGKPTLMSYRPADGWSPTSVFEVFTVSIAPITDDFAETMWTRRDYAVRLVCHPTVRSVDKVLTPAIEPAPGAAPVIVEINAGTSLANWSSVYGSLTDEGDHLAVNGSGSPRPTYTAPSPVDLTSTKYVSLLMTGTDADGVGAITTPLPALKVDDVDADLVATSYEYAAGRDRQRYHFRVPASKNSGTVFTFAPTLRPRPNKQLEFLSLQRSDSPPIIGTARQRQMSVSVAGSARTQGSLQISHPTAGLGSVLAYTWPRVAQSYSPSMRQYIDIGSTAVVSEDRISGSYDLLDDGVSYSIPATAIVPGAHQWMVRVACSNVGVYGVNWTAQMEVGGIAVGPLLSGTRSIPFGSAGTYRNVVLAREMLPVVNVPANSTAILRLTLVSSVPASDIALDEGWLFNTTVGRLTWVECLEGAPSAGGPSNRVWINAATFDSDRPTILRGFAADGSDSYNAGANIIAPGRHEFEPPFANVLTVTSGTRDALTSLEHYPRWGTHAAL